MVNEDIKSQNEEFETINKKKVDIKILVIGEFVENVKYAVVDGGSGNYRLIEDQISMLCERHKNKPFQEVEVIHFINIVKYFNVISLDNILIYGKIIVWGKNYLILLNV